MNFFINPLTIMKMGCILILISMAYAILAKNTGRSKTFMFCLSGLVFIIGFLLRVKEVDGHLF